MTTPEKVLLVSSIVISWAYAFFVRLLFDASADFTVSLILVSLGMVLWLTPFALLTLFCKRLRFPTLAFFLGSLGFFLLVKPEYYVYTGFGTVILLLGFIAWFLNVRASVKQQTSFATSSVFAGISLFFYIISAFAGLVYYYSPITVREIKDPHLPESYFEILYTPASAVLNAFTSHLPPDQRLTPDQIKPTIYGLANAALADLAKTYQPYIPFVFAASVFFAIRTLLWPLGYMLYAFVFLLVEMCLSAGWLQKDVIQVPKDVVRF